MDDLCYHKCTVQTHFKISDRNPKCFRLGLGWVHLNVLENDNREKVVSRYCCIIILLNPRCSRGPNSLKASSCMYSCGHYSLGTIGGIRDF